jgi:hypothetical protein
MRVRPYVHAMDFDVVGRLLLEAYRPGDVFDPWLQPPWEYMHVHPLVRGLDRSRFGVGVCQVAGVATAGPRPTDARC